MTPSEFAEKKPRTKPYRWEACNMSISTVTTDDLRRMNGKEGLVLQGLRRRSAGVAGRHQRSAHRDEGILENGSKFGEYLRIPKRKPHKYPLFHLRPVEIDMGKLAMWRLHSHEQFGGTWLSDYVPNRLGGFS